MAQPSNLSDYFSPDFIQLATNFETVLGKNPIDDPDKLKDAVALLFIRTDKGHLAVESSWLNPMNWISRILRRKDYVLTQESSTTVKLRELQKEFLKYTPKELKAILGAEFKHVEEFSRRLDTLLGVIETKKENKLPLDQKLITETFFNSLRPKWKEESEPTPSPSQPTSQPTAIISKIETAIRAPQPPETVEPTSDMAQKAEDAQRAADEAEAAQRADEAKKAKEEVEETKTMAEDTIRTVDVAMRVADEAEAAKKAEDAQRAADEAEAAQRADEAKKAKEEGEEAKTMAEDVIKVADDVMRVTDEAEATQKAEELKRVADEAKALAEWERTGAQKQKIEPIPGTPIEVSATQVPEALDLTLPPYSPSTTSRTIELLPLLGDLATKELTEVQNKLGLRAVGTVALSGQEQNSYQLHIIKNEANQPKIETYSLAVDPSTQELVSAGRHYKNLNSFLTELNIKDIYTVDSKLKQFDEIERLKRTFCCQFTTEQLDRALLEDPTRSPFHVVFADDDKAPFLLVPPDPKKGGDFTIISGLKMVGVPPKPRLTHGEPITVLEDGKIKHGGRIVENFEQFTRDFAISDFLYDAYAAESTCHDLSSVKERLLDQEAPANCFLVWKTSENQTYVSVRTTQPPEEPTIDTYELKQKEGEIGAFVLIDQEGAKEIPVKGEPLSFLRQEMYPNVSSYGQAQAQKAIRENRLTMAKDLTHFLEDKEKERETTDLARIATHAKSFTKNAPFTLSKAKGVSDEQLESLTLTTYSPKSEERRKLGWLLEKGKELALGTSWTAHTYTIHLRPDGKVDVFDNENMIPKPPFHSIDAFKAYLDSMDSVKVAETRIQQAAAERRQIESAITKVVDEAKKIGCAASNPNASQVVINDYQAILGKSAVANKYVISRDPGSDTLVFNFQSDTGEPIKLQVTKDGITIGGETKSAENITLDWILTSLGTRHERKVALQPISTLTELKNTREAFLEGVKKCPGYLPSGSLADVKSAFIPYLAVLATAPKRIYALSIGEDAAQVKQLFLSYVNDKREVVSVRIEDTLSKESLTKMATQTDQVLEQTLLKQTKENDRLGNSYGVEIQTLQAKQAALKTKSAEITASTNFYSNILNKKTAETQFKEMELFFDKNMIEGSWLIRPEEPKVAPSKVAPSKVAPSWFALPSISFSEKPPTERCIISINRGGSQLADYVVAIDPQSGQFYLPDMPTKKDKKYTTIEEIAKDLGAARPYNSLIEDKKRAEQKEKELTIEKIKMEPVISPNKAPSQPQPAVQPVTQKAPILKREVKQEEGKEGPSITLPDLSELILASEVQQWGRRLVGAHYWWTQTHNRQVLNRADSRALLVAILSCSEEDISIKFDKLFNTSAKTLGITATTKVPANQRHTLGDKYPPYGELATFLTNLKKWSGV